MEQLRHVYLTFTDADSEKIINAAKSRGLNSTSLRSAVTELLDVAINSIGGASA